MPEGPTPEQQADYLVRKLEQTIRDNRTVRGMSFATWQAIAREEITNALRAVEKRHSDNDRSISRSALVASSAIVTIGFWGALVSVDRTFGPLASMVFMVCGAALLFIVADWALRRAGRRYATRSRTQRLARIEHLDRRIKRMETEMQKKHDRLKEKMEEFEG